jgi:xylulose-5-phosphate/fructose-6-phosphate phosphoketolase
MGAAYDFDVSISSAVSVVDGQDATNGHEPIAGPLDADLLERMQRYWEAANYLTVAQIYLLENPLLREPLRVEQIKPRSRGTSAACGGCAASSRPPAGFPAT